MNQPKQSEGWEWAVQKFLDWFGDTKTNRVFIEKGLETILSEQRAKLVEEIKSLKAPEPREIKLWWTDKQKGDKRYNQAIDDIIKLLETK